MTSGSPPPASARHAPRLLGAGLGVVLVVIAATLGCRSLGPSSSTAATPTANLVRQHRDASASPTAVPSTPHRGAPASPLDTLARGRRGALGVADGVVPKGTTVFDDHLPAVTKLDPTLLHALRRAATDAARDGDEFFVNSGWRSPQYQEQLLEEAVSKYGSRAEAARWVATPTTSAHVSGDAVDIGHSDATAWLSKHGAAYGLCQTYRNEPWHFELRPQAVEQGCPAMYADPTQDPRMHQ
jgi:D-alanyl-D-alanine carboxypeptidase